jgi:hypothetical protein
VKVFVVERTFGSPIALEVAERAVLGENPCYAIRGIRQLASYVSPDGSRTVCVYEAPDAEVLREASRALGLPIDRIWPAHMFVRPPDDDDR